MKYLIVILSLFLCSCATNPLERKRKTVLECTKDLITYDSSTLDAFEVCRKVYRLK